VSEGDGYTAHRDAGGRMRDAGAKRLGWAGPSQG
jgi:hypothetical protein